MPWTRFRKKRDMPEGLWSKCKACGATLYQKDLEKALSVCTECGHHMRIGAHARLSALCDRNSFVELWDDLRPTDPLGFVDQEPYPQKVQKSAKKSKLSEAAVAGRGTIEGQPVSLCLLDFGFMGGSMGTVVGEKVTRAIELATKEKIPVIVLSCSGGARMHEGALSLMQMAKTSAALARLERAGGLYISILANPTTGGVMASFAALGDLIFAEPGALIGFAGPRVIQETLRIELPEGFQTSEFLLEHGFIDRIIARADLRTELARSLRLLWSYEPSQLCSWEPPVLLLSDGEEGGASATGEAPSGPSGDSSGPEAAPENDTLNDSDPKAETAEASTSDATRESESTANRSGEDPVSKAPSRKKAAKRPKERHAEVKEPVS